MTRMILAIGFLTQSLIFGAFAHEGHQHDAPKTLKPLKGGVIKSTGAFHFEVVSKGTQLKIFVLDEEMNQADPANFEFTATTELPRSKKREPLDFIYKENFFEASFDAQGVHRYTLHLDIKDKAHKKETKLQYTIEPRRGK